MECPIGSTELIGKVSVPTESPCCKSGRNVSTRDPFNTLINPRNFTTDPFALYVQVLPSALQVSSIAVRSRIASVICDATVLFQINV